MQATTHVILVDENDQQLGVAEKLSAHQQGLLHRAFSVFIYRDVNKHREVLLQQRHPKKYHSGGLWTNTCCSHPAPNESIIDAATRRLHEEMGIRAALTEIGVFHYTAPVGNHLIENEVDHVLIGKMPDQTFQYDPAEIVAIQWVEINQLANLIKNHPEEYTAWLGQALGFLSRKGS